MYTLTVSSNCWLLVTFTYLTGLHTGVLLKFNSGRSVSVSFRLSPCSTLYSWRWEAVTVPVSPRITESQHGLGWNWPFKLSILTPLPWAWSPPTRSCCSEPCPMGFWVIPGMAHLPPLWETRAPLSPPPR